MTSRTLGLRWLGQVGLAVTVGLAVGGLSAPAVAQEKSKINVKLGITTPDDSILAVNGRMWNQLVEHKTKGRVTVTVFPSGQLGKERAQIEGLVTGTGDASMTISTFTGMYPEIRFWDLPFLFQSTDQVVRLAYSGMYDDLQKAFDKENMVYMGTVGYGWRQFVVRNKPYKIPADFVGQKHRIPGGKSKAMLFEALGASPSTVSFPELYQALVSGVIDSADNPVQILYSAKHYEPTPYLSLLNYVYNPNVLAVGKPFWSRLDKEAQDALREAAWILQGWSIQAAERFDAEYLTKMKEAKPDLIVNTLDPATIPLWKEKTKPVYAAFVEETSQAWANNIFQTVEGGYYVEQMK